jgi:hypothetical protein
MSRQAQWRPDVRRVGHPPDAVWTNATVFGASSTPTPRRLLESRPVGNGLAFVRYEIGPVTDYWLTAAEPIRSVPRQTDQQHTIGRDPMNMLKKVGGVAAAGAATVAIASGALALGGEARGAGQLRDVQVGSHEPFDHATAQVIATVIDGTTTVSLKVQGIEHDAAGTVFGAHVHVGACVVGNGAAAGPHYKSDGATPSAANEVWLDFEVQPNGTAESVAEVPFVIPEGGAASVMIHALPTSTGPVPSAGSAGARWACLPVQF